MHYSTLLTAASVASVALAAPAPAPASAPAVLAGEGNFKIQRFRNDNATRLSPQVAMRRAFGKHGLTYSNDPELVSLDATRTTHQHKGSRTSGGRDSFRSWLSSILQGETAAPDANGGSGSGSSPAETTAAATVTDAPATTDAATQGPTSTAATSAATTEAASVPSSTTAAAASGTGGVTGEATTTPEEQGAFYLTPVNVGGQTLNLNLDTGSADLWVFDKSVSGRGFDSTKSTTFKALDGYTFEIKYGDGSNANGTVGMDTVSLGKATVQNQAVELATHTSDSFSRDTVTDGLLGLGFSNINSVTPKQQKTFFDNVMGQLDQPLFTVTLNEAGAGEYEFGTLDKSKYTGDIHYAPVDSSKGFWQFDSASFQIGGKTTQNPSASPAIADTGTTLCLVDPTVVQEYYAQVSGAAYDSTQGGYTYDCTATLPEFGVALGATNYYVTIPSNQITYGSGTGGKCFGGIQSNEGQGVQIFGDALLKEHFVVFDGKGPQVGFADRTATATGSA